MKKIFSTSILFLIFVVPIVSLAADKTVTVEWIISKTTNVQDYLLYYSPNSDMSNKISQDCDPLQKIAATPTIYSMTCNNVPIIPGTVAYFTIAMITPDGESESSIFSQDTLLSTVQNFTILTPISPSTQVCLGYETSLTCELTSIPPDYYTGSASTTYTRSATFLENGTLSKIAIYSTAVLPPAGSKVVAYKHDTESNEFTLIATGNFTPEANAWNWSEELVAEPGQSLNVVTGDTIYFGIFIEGGASYQVARTSNTGTNAWYFVSSPTLLSSVFARSWTAYTNNLAAELSYER